MINIKKLIYMVTLLACPVFGQAANVEVGERLAMVVIEHGGEIVVAGDDIQYAAWNTGLLAGKVGVIQHLAARMGVDGINKPFIDALTEAAFSLDKFSIATIVNIDDAMWGTAGLVQSELKRNKEEHPLAIIVADKEGSSLKTWGLATKNSAIAVLDKQGTVVFFKEGAMDASEIVLVMEMIEKML